MLGKAWERTENRLWDDARTPTALEALMHTSPGIDMLTPAQTGNRLSLDQAGILDLVNSGRLPAYNLGGSIRFKVVDVAACHDALVAG